jgi:hypothetical protein
MYVEPVFGFVTYASGLIFIQIGHYLIHLDTVQGSILEGRAWNFFLVLHIGGWLA